MKRIIILVAIASLISSLTATEALIEVHLGPEWYLDSQKFSIEVGDSLELKGSRVIYNGKPTIIAARLTKEDRVLTLRDDNGLPLWSRRQR
jgi:hypothetical protein